MQDRQDNTQHTTHNTQHTTHTRNETKAGRPWASRPLRIDQNRAASLVGRGPGLTSQRQPAHTEPSAHVLVSPGTLSDAVENRRAFLELGAGDRQVALG